MLACKALATVRQLAIPGMQVNIDEKQVNVVVPNTPGKEVEARTVEDAARRGPSVGESESA